MTEVEAERDGQQMILRGSETFAIRQHHIGFSTALQRVHVTAQIRLKGIYRDTHLTISCTMQGQGQRRT